MADYLVTDTELTSIANAIRTKGGTSAQLVYPTDFISAINAISPSLVRYAIRPDATLVQRYTYDKYMNADESITIPSYSTSAQTVKASGSIGTITLDRNNYFYYVVERMLTIPTYTITTTGKGRCEFHMGAHIYDVVDIPASTIHALVDTSKLYTTRLMGVSASQAVYREVYYSSATALSVANTQAYGTVQIGVAPTVSGGVLTINSPTVSMRGHTSYFTSTYANIVTDIRAQYVIEVYKSPKNSLNIDGWGDQQLLEHLINCVNATNHKLT